MGALIDRAVSERPGDFGADGPLAGAELLLRRSRRGLATTSTAFSRAWRWAARSTPGTRGGGVSLLTLPRRERARVPGRLPGRLRGRPAAAPLAGDESETDIAEERRLFFVGITRARSRLFLFHGAKRPPSPFLADLAAALLDRRSERESGPRRPEQLRLL